jgi:hypothetical protein
VNRAVVDVIGRGVLGAVAGGIAGLGLNWSWGWVHSPYCTSKEIRFCDIETDVVLPFLGAVWAIAAGMLLSVTLVLLNRPRAGAAYAFGCVYWFLLAVVTLMSGAVDDPAGATGLLVGAFALAGLQTGPWSELVELT